MGSYYTARYLKFNANTGSEEINGFTEDGHAITNDVLPILTMLGLLMRKDLLQKATGGTGVSGVFSNGSVGFSSKRNPDGSS